MAKILVLEPHPEVRDLLMRVAGRLGHDPVPPDGSGACERADVVLVEPADERALAAARSAKETYGSAVVCVSIYPPSKAALETEPVAYLQKPFSLLELERALVVAVERVRPATAA